MTAQSITNICKHCGAGFYRKPSHVSISVYCSKQCHFEAQKTTFTGTNNPNYRNAGNKVCVWCGDKYKSYDGNKKYCSSKCYHRSRVVSKQLKKQVRINLTVPCLYCGEGNVTGKNRTCGSEKCKKRHQDKIHGQSRIDNTRNCENCGVEFRSSPSVTKRYCSYKCSIESGSSMRAGMAAHRARQSYGATKKDFNHNELTGWFEDCGCSVMDLSAVGGGMPDAIIGLRGVNYFVEYKNPDTAYGRKGLNENQSTFAKWWTGGDVHIVRTQEDVVNFVNGDKVEFVAT